MKIYFFFLAILLYSCQQTKSNTVNANNFFEIKSHNNQNEEDTLISQNKIFSDLKLIKTIQSYTNKDLSSTLVYDSGINSPKSAIYSADGKKFYINSLEGGKTVVYDAISLQKIKEINHRFYDKDHALFLNNEDRIFDYQYKKEQENNNRFMGKPVEGCLSHNGKYLWITYYRRDFDEKAESPSAIAIIDTQKDEIVRVMPSGPLPKMIAASADSKYIMVTHWGDNTVAIIDTSGNSYQDFRYKKHIVIDQRLTMDFSANVDRDNDCGNCLRGTLFTPDQKYIFVAKMGGNGIAVIDTQTFSYIGTISGAKGNIRHLVIKNGKLFLSSNKFGAVQVADIQSIDFSKLKKQTDILKISDYKTVEIGRGVRTIEVTPDGKYIFACVNDLAKISVIETETMKEIFTLPISKFPVGMALSPNGRQLIVTSQGKDSVPNTGNAVNVLEVVYQ